MTPMHLHGSTVEGDERAWATFSAEPDRAYRYALGRMWDPERPTFSIVMLNPSTADHRVDDPTIRKCLHFARQEGCGSLLVRNLFALRSTDPRLLVRHPDPVGPLNLWFLARGVTFRLHVAAWGQLGTKRIRGLAKASIAQVMFGAPWVLALTERGYDRTNHLADRLSRQPRHPLYLENATRAKPWPGPNEVSR